MQQPERKFFSDSGSTNDIIIMGYTKLFVKQKKVINVLLKLQFERTIHFLKDHETNINIIC